MTRKEYEKQIAKAKRKSLHIKRKAEIREIANRYKPKKLETNKVIAIYLFIMLNIIVIYSMVTMFILHDLSCLSVLITDIGAQILLYAIYCLKAYHGKKQEETMKYKRERLQGVGEVLKSGVESEEEFPNIQTDTNCGDIYECEDNDEIVG